MINKDNGFVLNIQWRFPNARKYVFAFISLLVILLIIYGNSFRGAFQFDDIVNIVENKNIFLQTLDWSDIKNTFYGIEGKKILRPLSYFSFALNYYVDKLNVTVYHIVNFIIHYLTSVFLFLLIYKTLNLPKFQERYGSFSYSIALLSTIFWAISPVQVTAVTYIVQRMASMAGLFYVIAMYFYLKGRTADRHPHQVIYFGLCSFAAALSISSKENAAMLPLSIWVYDLLLIQGVTRQNLIKNLKLFAPVMIVIACIGLWRADITSILDGAAYYGRPFTLTERLLTEPRIIIFYISLLIYPVSSRLTLIHDIEISTSLLSPWTTLPAIALIFILIGLAAYLSRKKPFLAFCILFFFLNHVIESTFIPLELIYEHRNYVPSMFFFAPLAIFMLYVVDYFSYKKAMQWGIAALLVLLLAAQGHTVYLRNALFAHPILLWTDNLAKTPTLSRVYNNLGAAYWNHGSYDKAFELYLKAESLNRQINLSNRGVNLHNLGLYYLNIKGDYKKAQEYFEETIKFYPEYWRAYRDAAICDMRMGDLAKAGNRLVAALSIWPENAYLRETLALVLLKVGNCDDAIKMAQNVLIRNSDMDVSLSIIAEAYRRKGNNRLAIIYWERFLQQNPNNVEGNLALMVLYAKQNRKEKLDGTITKLVCLKGSDSWDNFIHPFIKDASVLAYTPSPKEITPLIRDYLRNKSIFEGFSPAPGNPK